MHGMHAHLKYDAETDVLSRIVEAMLSVESDLQDAADDEWSQILAEACRQQKRSAGAMPCQTASA